MLDHYIKFAAEKRSKLPAFGKVSIFAKGVPKKPGSDEVTR